MAVNRDEPSFLNYLDKLNIIGVHISIIEVNEFDHSIDIKIGDMQKHITREVAKNILIEVL